MEYRSEIGGRSAVCGSESVSEKYVKPDQCRRSEIGTEGRSWNSASREVIYSSAEVMTEGDVRLFFLY